MGKEQVSLLNGNLKTSPANDVFFIEWSGWYFRIIYIRGLFSCDHRTVVLVSFCGWLSGAVRKMDESKSNNLRACPSLRTDTQEWRASGFIEAEDKKYLINVCNCCWLRFQLDAYRPNLYQPIWAKRSLLQKAVLIRPIWKNSGQSLKWERGVINRRLFQGSQYRHCQIKLLQSFSAG